MRVRSLSSLYIVVAILFIMAVAAEVFTIDLLKPASLFASLIITTLATGIFTSAVFEKTNIKILE